MEEEVQSVKTLDPSLIPNDKVIKPNDGVFRVFGNSIFK